MTAGLFGIAQVPAAAAEPNASAAATRSEVLRLVDEATTAERREPEAVRRLTDQALALLGSEPDPDLEALVRELRCDYFNERDRDSARREIARLRELEPRLTQGGARIGMLACDGELHEQTGDNSRAMALYEQAVGVAESLRDERRLAKVLFLRGYLRGVLGDFPQGLLDLKRSMALYEKLRLPANMRTAINGVAGLYSRVGALDEARRHYEDALRTMPETPVVRERVVVQHNLARNYERAGRWDEAQRLFEQVLAGSRELEYTRGAVHALRGLAAVRNAKGDPQRALQMVEEAQRIAAQVPDEPLRARLLLQRALALRLLNRAPESPPLLREAIRIFASGDAGAEEGEAREELARTAAELGDWRQAYDQQVQARQIARKLYRAQIDNHFATVKAQFDSDARERELVLLQRENRASERALAEERRAAKLQIVAAVLASALALVLAALTWRQWRTSRAMRALAMTDELTGLPNRRNAIGAAERLIGSGPGGALCILDVDHFKRINDRHGHAAGDAVLQQIAAAWRGAAGPDVTLGRLGGEEFIAVLPAGDLAAGRALAERLRAAAAALDLSHWLGPTSVTLSGGVTALAPGDTLAAALARADAALYRAKESGRDRVEVEPAGT